MPSLEVLPSHAITRTDDIAFIKRQIEQLEVGGVDASEMRAILRQMEAETATGSAPFEPARTVDNTQDQLLGSWVVPDFRLAGLTPDLDWLGAIEPFRPCARCILATGGSVAANRFRHEVMLRRGWTFLRAALGMIDLPIAAAEPPRIHARILMEPA